MTEHKDDTPTEMLIKAMERFSESEPDQAMIIYTDSDGHLNWQCTSSSRCQQVGMLEFCKLSIMAYSLKKDSQ